MEFKQEIMKQIRKNDSGHGKKWMVSRTLSEAELAGSGWCLVTNRKEGKIRCPGFCLCNKVGKNQ